MKKKEKSLKRRVLYVGIAVLIIVVGFFLPAPEGLGQAGKMSFILLIAGIFLWVLEPMPLAISAFLLMALMPLFGVIEVSGVWSGFISSVIFFILASFAFTAALLKTKIPAKLVFTLLRISKGKPKSMILSFMVAAALCSLFISDVACAALMGGIAMSSIMAYEKNIEPGKSSFGKALMIGASWGSVTGGQCLPSGSSLNIMTMGLLKANTGITISFLDWGLICTPFAIILTVICWLSLVLVFKPKPLSKEVTDAIAEEGTKQGKLDSLDYKVITIIIMLFVFWIASNWTGWDTTIIAVFGAVALFLPGVDILKWSEYVDCVAWNIVLLTGGVQSLAGGIQKQGAGNWLFSSTVGRLAVTPFAIVGSAALFAPLVRCLIPVGPAFIAVCLIPLISLADAFGISPVIFAVIIAVNGTTTYLLGLDQPPMLTYRYGYWTFGEYFKAGIFPTLVQVICHALLLAPLVNIVGY